MFKSHASGTTLFPIDAHVFALQFGLIIFSLTALSKSSHRVEESKMAGYQRLTAVMSSVQEEEQQEKTGMERGTDL